MPNHEGTYPPTRYKAKSTKSVSRLSWRPDALFFLRLMWIVVIFYQESQVFKSAIRSCSFERWTSPILPTDETLALIGDPQLVDENTYSRRGLALYATQFYTDLYMRRNWRILHRVLEPKTTIFTGDLFDGGREWATAKWEKEYDRFQKVFPQVTKGKVLTSLPGNHDIGIADGIKEDVYDRFRGKFGQTSRLLEIGEWDIILLDTVALSSSKSSISSNARSFMEDMAHRDTTVRPRMLITHVPLYRDPNAACGPLRESNSSIRIQRGYQYQNVLEAALSEEIMKAIRPAVIFAGDDHDHCDYRHPNGIHEFNVKTFSWAMGVQRPGIQLVSFSKTRYETALCLLPSQLILFKRYGVLLILTILLSLLLNIRLAKHVTVNGLSLPRTNKDDAGKSARETGINLMQVWRSLWLGVGRVAWVVLLFYVYMIWW